MWQCDNYEMFNEKNEIPYGRNVRLETDRRINHQTLNKFK
jgi:hypothetical protein